MDNSSEEEKNAEKGKKNGSNSVRTYNQMLEIRPFSNVCCFTHTRYEKLPWRIPKIHTIQQNPN
jgi:hypothetical protein